MSAVIASLAAAIPPSFPTLMAAGYTKTTQERYCLQQPMMGDPVTISTCADPTVSHFRSQIVTEIEHATTGSDAADAIARVFTAHHDAAVARESALRTEVRSLAGELSTYSAMLQQVSRAAGGDMEATARALADARRHQDALEAARELLDGWPSDDVALSQVAREMRVLVDIPATLAPTRPVRSVIIAMVPDQRYRVGWFHCGGESEPRPLAFAGWALVATPGGRAGVPEGAFLMGGRVWPLTELERHEYMLERME